MNTGKYIYIERNERIMKSTDCIFTDIQWQTVYLSRLKLSHINRKGGSMDQHYFVVSRQLAEQGEACRTGEACARWLAGQEEIFD